LITAVIETYGVQVDLEIHRQVLGCSEPLSISPYGGFINPELTPVMNDAGEVMNIAFSYPSDFVGQMLKFGRDLSYLPDYNQLSKEPEKAAFRRLF